jgi:hypothetical protein
MLRRVKQQQKLDPEMDSHVENAQKVPSAHPDYANLNCESRVYLRFVHYSFCNQFYLTEHATY